MQKLGRALRPKPFPAIILDHAGNCRRATLGLPEAERIWTLDSRRRRRADVAGEAPTKACPGCSAEIPAGAKECRHCGFVYPQFTEIPEHEEGELVEVDRGETPQQRKERLKREEEGAANNVGELVAIGLSRGNTRQRALRWAQKIMYRRRVKSLSERAASARLEAARNPDLPFGE